MNAAKQRLLICAFSIATFFGCASDTELLSDGSTIAADATDPRDADTRDAGPPETGPRDADPPEAGSDAGEPIVGLVSVRVVNISGPVAGTRVIAGDTSGAMLRETTTNAIGIAELEVPAGGTITAAIEDPLEPGRFEFHAVLGVEPGDRITFGKERPTAPPPITQLDFTFAGAYPSAKQHGLNIGCHQRSIMNASASALSLDYPPAGCAATATISALLTAHGLNRLIAYAAYEDAPIRAPSTAIDLSPWRTPELPLEVEITNVPSEYLDFAIGASMVAGGQRFGADGDIGSLSTSSTARASFVLPDFGDGMQLDVQLGLSRFARLSRRGARIQSFTADGAQFLSPVTDIDIDVDLAGRLELTPVTNADATDLDATLYSISWPDAGETDLHRRWAILVPPQAPTTIRAPELPADLREHGRAPQFLVAWTAVHVEADYLSYADVRNGPLDLRNLIIPPRVNGTLRVTE